ncbi:MAG: hypothetical protein GKR89_07540 [Candidatus Latescibacteria bacterium]|nr:hypothetical protein [Candidatus Latescibacterota bacterium]
MALAKIKYIGRIFWGFRFYLLCAVAVLVLWDTWLVKPFRLFVVMVHEICHAGAALISGGQVVEMRTNWDESGHTLTRGGFFPLISSAGYVGSAALGALLIYTANWPQAQRATLLAIGVACVGMTVWYTPVGGLDFYLGALGGVLIMGLALRSQRAAALGSGFLGVVLCLYSLYDFRTDLWLYPERTDAGILAQYWCGGCRMWLAYPIAFIWVLLSLSFMYRAMRAVSRQQRR